MDTGHLFATVRGLINEKLTPEEERANIGDLGYARWAPYSPFRRSADEKENAGLTSVWAFLASALEAMALVPMAWK